VQLHHRYTPYNYFESVIQFNKVLYNDSYRTDADQNGGKEFAPSVELASLADVRASRSSALSDAPHTSQFYCHTSNVNNMVLSTLLSPDNDALSITQPSPMTSFDWSDFPLVHQFNPDDDEYIQLSSDVIDSSRAFQQFTSKKTKLNDIDKENLRYSYTLLPRPSYSSSPSSSFSSISSASSTCSDTSVTLRDGSHARRVSFAPRVEVREYEIVIGDHPSCELFPLSLGWSYSDSTFEGYSSPSSRRHGNQMKLTYLERKAKLQRVGGYTNEELQSAHKSNLRHVPTSAQLPLYS
jgi:hypothetical protein